MSIQEWSVAKLILAIAAWMLAFPVLLIVALILGVGNLGFTIPGLVLILVLWAGPAAWLVARWRNARRKRFAGDAA